MTPELVLILVCALGPMGGHVHEHCSVYHTEITPAYANQAIAESVTLFCEIVEEVYTKKGLVVTRCEDITQAKPEPEPDPGPDPWRKDIPIIKT